jgi:hypothetical protein
VEKGAKEDSIGVKPIRLSLLLIGYPVIRYHGIDIIQRNGL